MAPLAPPPAAAPRLKTHRPTGQAPWPLILLTGEPGSGKSWESAVFTGSERVGRAFWLDLGEGCAEEYGEVPGSNYEVIEHNGTWVDIIGQAEAVKGEAQQAADAGESPVVFVIDSMTSEWAMLSEWTDKRARRQKGNRAKLAEDPDAEIDVTTNLWNDANSRHNRLINMLKTFPGIVIMIASEKEVTPFDKAGNPVVNAKKEWKPEGQKFLARDCSVWIRLLRDEVPQVVKCRSVHYGIRPGVDKPRKVPNFSFDWLVFDLLKCDPATTRARPMHALDADQVMPDEAPDESAKPSPALAAKLNAAVTYLVQAKDAAEAAKRLHWAATVAEAEEVVGQLVTQSDADALGLHDGHHDGKPVTVLLLAELVVGYADRHGVGPRVPPVVTDSDLLPEAAAS